MIIRWLTILMHKFDLHYAPVHGPLEDGRYQRWCQWCGMRDSWSYDPRKPIPGPLLTEAMARAHIAMAQQQADIPKRSNNHAENE